MNEGSKCDALHDATILVGEAHKRRRKQKKKSNDEKQFVDVGITYQYEGKNHGIHEKRK